MEIETIKYTANFHLTHDCNMRCTYCYAGMKTKDAMSEDILEQSISFVMKQVLSLIHI